MSQNNGLKSSNASRIDPLLESGWTLSCIDGREILLGDQIMY